MSKMTKEEQERMSTEWYDRTHRNWGAWGSWFSWGPPVGMELFFAETAAAIWILTQAF